MICPFCKRQFSSSPALSRTDNAIQLCPRCGTREALEVLGLDTQKIEDILNVIYKEDVE